MWRIFGADLVHTGAEQCRLAWWIVWRRIAGGLSKGQQHQIYLRLAPQASRRSYMREDPVHHHRLRPSFEAVMQGARFTTNAIGLRDREYAIPKPPGVFRILMLGDSFTEGGGLENDETVAKIVETGLRRGPCGNGVDVINAGHASYSPILEYLLLREPGLRLQPDLVVLNFDMTDVHDDFVRTRIARLDAQGLPTAVVPDRRIETWLIMPPVFPRPLRWLEDRMARLAVYQAKAGDDAAAAHLEVGKPPGAHLVIQQVAGQPGGLRGFFDGVGQRLDAPVREGLRHGVLPRF